MRGDFAEAVLPLDEVLAHARSDDLALTDAERNTILRYRAAALRAAEIFTGYRMGWIEVVSEQLPWPSVSPGARTGTLFLPWRTADTTVSWWSADGTGGVATVRRWARKLVIPVRDCAPSFDCCGCGAGQDPLSIGVSYRAGFACPEDVPAPLLVACMKYVAHLVGNPGDELYGVGALGDSRQLVTSDPLKASGAGHIWFMFRDMPA